MISVNCTLTAMTRMKLMVRRYPSSSGTQVSEFQRYQQILVNQVTDRRGQGQDEGCCERHAERRFEVARYAHERAQAEEADQHKIVDENRANQDQDQV
jgi:hypothetical protein